MLGQSALVRGSASAADNRTFLYEVTGLHQSDQTENNGYPVRNSGSVFIQVPYRRMNEEMQRITRLGGKIVQIHADSSRAEAKPAAKSQSQAPAAEE
jgi:sulfite reductase alpha subunit-like flavoprotein